MSEGQKEILVVDDEATLCDAVVAKPEHEGVKAYAAQSVDDAIKMMAVIGTVHTDKIYQYLRLGVTKYFMKVDRQLEDIDSDVLYYLETEAHHDS